MTPAALAFMHGDTSPEVLADMRASLLRWAEQTGDKPLGLHRCLSLGGPRNTRASLRNHHLQLAAAMLPGPSSWARCQQLAEACRTFEARRFQAWKKLDAIPDRASELDRVLWNARQFGELACTPENYIDLLSNQ